jgi:hypothetical protein
MRDLRVARVDLAEYRADRVAPREHPAVDVDPDQRRGHRFRVRAEVPAVVGRHLAGRIVDLAHADRIHLDELAIAPHRSGHRG